MKKSEKIEIRVSLAEKNALAQLASEEGRSVSQLVRDVVKKYAAINMARPHTRFSNLKIMTLISCGFILGIGVPVLNGLKNAAPTSPTYMVHGTINKNGFGFPVEGENGDHQTVKIGKYNIILDIGVDSDDQGSKYALVLICRNQIKECEKVTQAKLNLNYDSSSVWQTGGSNGEDIFFVIQPTTS